MRATIFIYSTETRKGWSLPSCYPTSTHNFKIKSFPWKRKEKNIRKDASFIPHQRSLHVPISRSLNTKQHSRENQQSASSCWNIFIIGKPSAFDGREDEAHLQTILYFGSNSLSISNIGCFKWWCLSSQFGSECQWFDRVKGIHERKSPSHWSHSRKL